jgi:hypothetical protein
MRSDGCLRTPDRHLPQRTFPGGRATFSNKTVREKKRWFSHKRAADS